MPRYIALDEWGFPLFFLRFDDETEALREAHAADQRVVEVAWVEEPMECGKVILRRAQSSRKASSGSKSTS